MMIAATKILIIGAILLVLALLLSTVFGSKTMHDTNADLAAYLSFGAGLGCVVVAIIVFIGGQL